MPSLTDAANMRGPIDHAFSADPEYVYFEERYGLHRIFGSDEAIEPEVKRGSEEKK